MPARLNAFGGPPGTPQSYDSRTSFTCPELIVTIRANLSGKPSICLD